MNDNLSVLFLASWYPTPDYPTHGIFIKNHAKALANYCNVIVLYVYSSDNVNRVILEHTQNNRLNEYILVFPKSKIPFLKNLIHLVKYYYYYYKLAILTKKHFPKIHFAQINVIYPVSLFFPIIKNVLNIQTYTIFEQWTGYLKEDGLYKGILRKFITKKITSNALKIWCLCNYQKQSMLQHHLQGNYDLLGNVVNTNIFQCKKKSTHPKKTFLHISTLDDRQKNITGILKAFADIEKQGYDFQLVIIGGKEEYLQKAQQTAKSLGLKNIIFKGILPQEELPAYYQSADALVMFSNYETFCVVVYEALSCGTYVITTDVADLGKIISKKYGTIIPKKDETQLKQAIMDVLENKVSCASEEAHQLIEEHFSEKQIGKKLYDYYSMLLQKLK